MGTLMYHNLYGHENLERRCEEGVMSVRVRDFQKYTVNIGGGLKDMDASSHHAWIFPEVFNPPRHFNDPRYLEGERFDRKTSYC